MTNATHDDDNARTRIEGEPAGKPAQPHERWCQRHEDGEGGWCCSELIRADEAHLEISNGTLSGEPKLFGLGDFTVDGITLDQARAVYDALGRLLGAVEPTTARFTWEDIAAENRTIASTLTLAEADRLDPPFGTSDLRDDCATYDTYGGLLAWNRTRDEEGGHLVMFTGQTAEQERRVLANASWLVSCGAVYAASPVGMTGWKTSYDDRCTVGGDELLVWLLPNSYDLSAAGR